MRKKQQLSIGPCKSLPNSPSHSSVPAASIPSVHINQVRSKSWKMAHCSCSYLWKPDLVTVMQRSHQHSLYVISFIIKNQNHHIKSTVSLINQFFTVVIPFPLLTLWLSSPLFPPILLVPLNLSRSPGGQWWGCIQRLLLLCSFHPQHKSARDAHWDHRCLQHAHAYPQAVKAPLQHFHSKYATADAKQHPLTLLEGMLPSTLCPTEGDR